MNIEYLKYFAELAKTQHYGQAAKALNISQRFRCLPIVLRMAFRFFRKKGGM